MDNYKEFYRDISSKYHDTRYGSLYGNIFKELHHETIAGFLEDIGEDSMVLEVACGTGHTSELMSDLGIKSISCDLTPAMIQQAMGRLANKDILPDFLEADALELPFADNMFDVVISTRFMHLFKEHIQMDIIAEMYRVLKPEGRLIIDFDNLFNRWLMCIPFLIYNVIRYHRVAPYSIYNRIKRTENMLNSIGIVPESISGVGGTHLFLLAKFFPNIALRIGRACRNWPWRFLTEQFVISGKKQ